MKITFQTIIHISFMAIWEEKAQNSHLFVSCNDTTSTSKKQKHSTILPMLTIRAEIKANICSIALELKYNNQVLLHCLKVSTLSTNFLIITRFFIVFFFIEKSKESYCLYAWRKLERSFWAFRMFSSFTVLLQFC